MKFKQKNLIKKALQDIFKEPKFKIEKNNNESNNGMKIYMIRFRISIINLNFVNKDHYERFRRYLKLEFAKLLA